VLATLSGRFATPYVALLMSCAWACVLLCIPWDLGELINYFGAASWLFYGGVAAALMRLRTTDPGVVRPFKVPLYPFTPLLLVLLALVLIGNSIYASPVPTLCSLGFVLLGVPVRRFLRWCNGTGGQERTFGFSPP